VNAGLCLGNGPIVQLNFGGFALDENALHSFTARGNVHALSYGRVVGRDRYGYFDRCISRICDVDGDEPVARSLRRRKYALDGEVRKALVRIYPVSKEPTQVAPRPGLLD